MWTFSWTCSGLYTCYDTLIVIFIIVYTFLETVVYTVFITTLSNGNYIILGLKRSLYWH